MKRCFVISSAILTTSAKIAGGKSMQVISYYYNNARFRDAILAGSFYQQDPLAEKYYPFTPYHYSACNPLKFADINGMDHWQLDKLGEITLMKETEDNFDVLNSEYNNMLNLSKGILCSQIKDRVKNKPLDETIAQREYSITVLKIQGDSDPLFEFLINNTDVEWSQIKTKNSNNHIKLEYLGTSHDSNTDVSGGYMISLTAEDYSVMEANHSHPGLSRVISPGDSAFVADHKPKYPNMIFKIFIPFDFKNPRLFDENDRPRELQEIIVTP